MTKILSLSPAEDALYTALASREDVKIARLYRLVKRQPIPHLTLRDRQIALGPFITRLNKKLVKRSLRVVPGRARHTYRLKRISA